MERVNSNHIADICKENVDLLSLSSKRSHSKGCAFEQGSFKYNINQGLFKQFKSPFQVSQTSMSLLPFVRRISKCHTIRAVMARNEHRQRQDIERMDVLESDVGCCQVYMRVSATSRTNATTANPPTNGSFVFHENALSKRLFKPVAVKRLRQKPRLGRFDND